MAKIKFTHEGVAALALPPALPSGKPTVAEHWDTLVPGFGMRVSSTGTKSYQLFTRTGPKSARKLRRYIIGRYPKMTLAEARDKARSMLLLVEEGRDPRQVEIEHEAALEREQEEKKKAAALAKDNSFAAVRSEFLELHVKPKFKPAVARAYERALHREQFAAWEDRDIRSITKREITHLFGHWAKTTPVMADRALDYFKSMLSWASRELGIMETSQAAGISKPGGKSERDRVLAASELKLIWKAAGAAKGFEPIIRLLMLTGQRNQEITALRWSEVNDVDTAEPFILLPGGRAAGRTKNSAAHIVPLAPAAAEILRAMPRVGPVIFPGRDGKTPLKGHHHCKKWLDAHIKELAGHELPEWRLHDFRRSMVTHMSEAGWPAEIVKSVINHKTGGGESGVFAVYNRAVHLPQRRAALNWWASYILTIAAGKKPPASPWSAVAGAVGAVA